MIINFMQWVGEVLKGLIEITIKKIKINMFNRTINITNYNFFGQMSPDEMVRAVKGLGDYDQITIKNPSASTPDVRPAVESHEFPEQPEE